MNAEQISDQIDACENAIHAAISELNELVDELNDAGMSRAGRLVSAYTIPSMRSWITDSGQPGNLAEVRDKIETLTD